MSVVGTEEKKVENSARIGNVAVHPGAQGLLLILLEGVGGHGQDGDIGQLAVLQLGGCGSRRCRACGPGWGC